LGTIDIHISTIWVHPSNGLIGGIASVQPPQYPPPQIVNSASKHNRIIIIRGVYEMKPKQNKIFIVLIGIIALGFSLALSLVQIILRLPAVIGSVSWNL
jgi:hypothetical protein